MNLSLFELYLKFMIVMYFILFYLNLWFNIYFLNTHGYPWIPVDMKTIGGYPHNRYPIDIDTGTGQIFIHRIWCEEATIRTLSVLLTSLNTSTQTFQLR